MLYTLLSIFIFAQVFVSEASYGVKVNIDYFSGNVTCDEDSLCDFNIIFCLDDMGSDMGNCQTGWKVIKLPDNTDTITLGSGSYGQWNNPHTYYYKENPYQLYFIACIKDRDGLTSQTIDGISDLSMHVPESEPTTITVRSIMVDLQIQFTVTRIPNIDHKADYVWPLSKWFPSC